MDVLIKRGKLIVIVLKIDVFSSSMFCVGILIIVKGRVSPIVLISPFYLMSILCLCTKCVSYLNSSELITKSINRLDFLNHSLITRSKKGLVVTRTGHKLLSFCILYHSSILFQAHSRIYTTLSHEFTTLISWNY